MKSKTGKAVPINQGIKSSILQNAPIAVRIVSVNLILLFVITALIAVINFTAKDVQELSIKKTEAIMLAGQQEKLKLGTQTMAIALSVALQGISGRQEQHDIIKSYIND